MKKNLKRIFTAIITCASFTSSSASAEGWFDPDWLASCRSVVPHKAEIDLFLEKVTAITAAQENGGLTIPFDEALKQAIDTQSKSHSRVEDEAYKAIAYSAKQAIDQNWLIGQCLKRSRSGNNYALSAVESTRFEEVLRVNASFGIDTQEYFSQYCTGYLGPYLEFLKSRGATFDSDGDLDISAVDVSKAKMIEPNSKLATAIALFFSPKFANALTCRCNEEAIVAGKWVVPASPELPMRKLSDWVDSVNRNLTGFRDDLRDFMSNAAAANSSYVNLMTGRLWELVGYERGYQGSTAPEIAAVSAYKRMLSRRETLKKFGVSPDLRKILNDVVANANNFEMQALSEGMTKLNNAALFAVTAPFTLLLLPSMSLVPFAIGRMAPFLGPVILKSIAAQTANVALFAMSAGIGLSTANAFTDVYTNANSTNGTASSLICSMIEETSTTAVPAANFAPALQMLPVATAAGGAGAAYATGSTIWGANVFGGLNIAAAVGFVGSMGCSGVASYNECNSQMKDAQSSLDAAKTDAEVDIAWTKINAGVRACSAAGIDLGFAIYGASSFGSMALKKTIQNRKLLLERRTSFENELAQSRPGLERYTSTPIDEATMLRLPEAKPGTTGLGRYRKGFAAILEFLLNRAEVTKYMERLSQEVHLRIEQRNIDYQSMAPEALNALKMQELVRIFEIYEKREGFGPAIDLAGESTLSRQAFMDMLSKGSLFNDLVFLDANRNGHSHAKLTHRLQWTLVMMKMDEIRIQNPNYFEGMKAVDYYKTLGNVEMMKSLDWSNTGMDLDFSYTNDNIRKHGFESLWTQMFDSVSKSEFISPEYTRGAHLNTPWLVYE